MSPTLVFVTGVVLSVSVSLGAVAYVRSALHSLLVELCGTPERAKFWLAFSNITLVLVPLIFALACEPETGPGKNVIFEMAAQLKYVLVGFVVPLTTIALILSRFIPRNQQRLSPGSIR
jgi:hypothetical protein